MTAEKSPFSACLALIFFCFPPMFKKRARALPRESTPPYVARRSIHSHDGGSSEGIKNRSTEPPFRVLFGLMAIASRSVAFSSRPFSALQWDWSSKNAVEREGNAGSRISEYIAAYLNPKYKLKLYALNRHSLSSRLYQALWDRLAVGRKHGLPSDGQRVGNRANMIINILVADKTCKIRLFILFISTNMEIFMNTPCFFIMFFLFEH